MEMRSSSVKWRRSDAWGVGWAGCCARADGTTARKTAAKAYPSIDFAFTRSLHESEDNPSLALCVLGRCGEVARSCTKRPGIKRGPYGGQPTASLLRPALCVWRTS